MSAPIGGVSVGCGQDYSEIQVWCELNQVSGSGPSCLGTREVKVGHTCISHERDSSTLSFLEQ